MKTTVNFGNLQKTPGQLRKSSEDSGSWLEIVGTLRVGFGNLPMFCGRLPKSLEDFVLISENFLSTLERKVIYRYSWRVQFGFNWTLSSNQNPVILLSVL